jgi:fatty acid desaturase
MPLHCLVLLLLVIALSFPSFGHCIVLSFFFWLFYCLVLLLLVILLSCPSYFGHCIVLSFFFWSCYCLETIEWQKEKRQDNRMTKRRRTRQYNDQKKKDKTIEWPKEEGVIILSCPSSFGHSVVLSFLFWSLHYLILLLLVILLSCLFSFGHSIVLSFFFWEEGQENRMTKRRRTRQYNDQKKKDKTMQWPKEEGQDNAMTKIRRTRH